MKNIVCNLLAIAGIILSLASCKRDPIVYATSNYYVSIETETAPTDTEENLPRVYAVNFYDPGTGRLVLNTFVHPYAHPKDMPPGAYITGLVPGEYDLLVYCFDNNVITENEGSASRVYAHAKDVERSNGTPIVAQPDHHYVHAERITVPYVISGEGVHIIPTHPMDITESWTVKVLGVKNLSIAGKISLFISGQVRGDMLLPQPTKLNEKAIILFEGRLEDLAATKAEDETSLDIVAPYRTFGRFGDDVRCLLTVQIEGPNGTNYYIQTDVTDQIEDQQDKDRLIIVDSDLEIEERKDEGFNPQADEWKEDKTQIVLE